MRYWLLTQIALFFAANIVLSWDNTRTSGWAVEPPSTSVVAEALPQVVEQTVAAFRAINSEGEDAPPELYTMNLSTGETTLIALNSNPGMGIGCPEWSADGKQIICDTLYGDNWRKARILCLKVDSQRVQVVHLGRGDSPSFSPKGDRIAFLIGPDPGSDEAPGVWTMLADGTDRRRLGGFGRPQWPADGRWLLLSSMTDPLRVALIDAQSGDEIPLQLSGKQFLSRPAWAGNSHTIVAVMGGEDRSSLEILDISDPSHVQSKLTLLSNDQRGTWQLSDPVYDSSAARCFLVGTTEQGRALLSVDAARPGELQRLEADRFDEKLHDLALSPDGRYLLFCSNRAPRSNLLIGSGRR